MQKRNKFLSVLALLTFLLGVSATKALAPQDVKKVEAVSYDITWKASEQGYTDGELVSKKVIDDNFEIAFTSGRYLLAPRYFSEGGGYLSLQGISDDCGNGFLISPRPTNEGFCIKTIVVTATDAAYTSTMRTRHGHSINSMPSHTNQTFSDVTYTFTEATSFRYFRLENYASNEIRIQQITLSITDISPIPWKKVTSLTNSVEHYDIKRGQRLLITKPTIEPSNALYDYFLTTEDPRLTINGPYIIGVDVCENVVVTINTFGRTADGERLTTTFTVSVTDAPLTIDGALGIGYVSIDEKLYKIENVRVQDASLTTDSLVLHENVEATNTISVIHPNFNPLNTYTYVKGGTMSLFAKVRRDKALNKNFLVEPEVISYTDKAVEFANTIMASDEAGQCVTKYATVRAIVDEMSAEELAKLKCAGTVNDINFSAVRARYIAWAIHLGESDPYGDGTPISGAPLNSSSDNVLNTTILSIIFIGFTLAIGLYFVSARRKKLLVK